MFDEKDSWLKKTLHIDPSKILASAKESAGKIGHVASDAHKALKGIDANAPPWVKSLEDAAKFQGKVTAAFTKGAITEAAHMAESVKPIVNPVGSIVDAGTAAYKLKTDEKYRKEAAQSIKAKAEFGVGLIIHPQETGKKIGLQIRNEYKKAAAEGKGAEFIAEGVGKAWAMGAAMAAGAEFELLGAAGEGAGAVRGATSGAEATAAAESEGASIGKNIAKTEPPIDPAAPLERIPRSPTDPRPARPLGNIDNYSRQGPALRDAEGALGSTNEHVVPHSHLKEQLRNPTTGKSPLDPKKVYRESPTLRTQYDTALEKTSGDMQALRDLKASAGNPSPHVLREAGLEAGIERQLAAAKKTGDASVTAERANLAAHGQLGTVHRYGAEEARTFMKGATEAEIDMVLEGIENATVDSTFAAPKGMGIPLPKGPVPPIKPRIATNVGAGVEATPARARIAPQAEAPPAKVRVEPDIGSEGKIELPEKRKKVSRRKR
jgi:hypothetical protein